MSKHFSSAPRPKGEKEVLWGRVGQEATSILRIQGHTKLYH